MALFRRNKTIQLNADAVAKYSDKVAQIPDDLMARCPKCHKVYFTKQKPEDYCCMHCHHHLPFPAMERIDWLVDEGSFQEINADLWNDNPLGFPKYSEKLAKLQEATGLKEAIVTGTARLDGHDLALGVMDSRFVMASMGTAVGEKLVQLFDLATAQGLSVCTEQIGIRSNFSNILLIILFLLIYQKYFRLQHRFYFLLHRYWSLSIKIYKTDVLSFPERYPQKQLHLLTPIRIQQAS